MFCGTNNALELNESEATAPLPIGRANTLNESPKCPHAFDSQRGPPQVRLRE